jgi:hypothetical protein
MRVPVLSDLFNNDDQTAMAGTASDLTKLFFYKSFGEGDLYFSEIVNERWSAPKRMKSPVNSDAHEQSVATWNGWMFLSSDRPGGLGGHDIWWSRADENGSYTDFQPMSTVNTSGDEVDVSLSPDGRSLYYSSNESCMGDCYRIYVLHMDSTGRWGLPELLPEVNDGYNARYFYDADSVFYYCSEKPGGIGGYDIFKGHIMSPKPSVQKMLLAQKENDGKVDTTFIIEKSVDAVKSTDVQKDRYGVMDELLDSAGYTDYYARVQIGAFYNLTVEAFRNAYPSLRATPITIEWVKTEKGRIGKFMVDARYPSLKEAAAIQEEMWNKHKIKDAFIAVYDLNNERIAIYNSIKGEFVLLSPNAKPVIF